MANHNVFDASLTSELKFPDTKSSYSLKSSHLELDIKKGGLISYNLPLLGWNFKAKSYEAPKLEKAILQRMSFQEFK